MPALVWLKCSFKRLAQVADRADPLVGELGHGSQFRQRTQRRAVAQPGQHVGRRPDRQQQVIVAQAQRDHQGGLLQVLDQLVAVGRSRGQGADLLHDPRIPGDHRAVQREGEVRVAVDGRPLQAVLQGRLLGQDHLQVQLEMVQLLLRQGLVFDLVSR